MPTCANQEVCPERATKLERLRSVNDRHLLVPKDEALGDAWPCSQLKLAMQ